MFEHRRSAVSKLNRVDEVSRSESSALLDELHAENARAIRHARRQLSKSVLYGFGASDGRAKTSFKSA